MAGHRNSHGKRHTDYAENGGGKRRNPGDDTYAPGPDDTVYRYLCASRKIGSIIGRGGEIAKQLRNETQAKIRIGESVPGCDERVITIFSSSRETNTLEDAENKVCSAQDALFRVHERLATDDGPGHEDSEEVLPQVTVRLLVPSDQIGCIIGKGGHIIQGIRSETGAQIRVLSNDHIPACAISGDELLQISGDAVVVKKALLQVSSRLHDNPSRSHHLLSSSLTQPYPGSSHLGSSSTAPVVGLTPVISPYGGYKGDVAGDWPSIYQPPRNESSAKEFSLRLLCAAANVGGVIGKGGGIIKQIRQESGAFIKVDSSSSGAEDDCIITVSAKEFFEDPVSPTIDAAVRLQPRCSEKSDSESGEPSYTTRLLVSTSRIGCLIGKGGSIITEIRRSSRANIRILSKENVPKVAAEDEEMVQISGDLDVARNALVQITTRLKANFFEREGTLSALPPVVPYHPLPAGVSDEPRYLGRDPKPAGHGYLYSSGYRASDDIIPADSYANYGSSQASGGGYGAYSGYSGRSSSSGLSGHNSLPYGKRHGY
ncbi:KH domain-containing protein HEN4-like [Phragmites australis]|uniref:KH domain-containing protein HEN4-like n=1 Tax=Phragmites australis TaxID=29695 RepID=UPI002D79B50D|nr:KH domain-containing protein HEN4-like [Phragmites australis]XP_062211406.1 KH domain-containing protein HEN4-like [Phragmites australis]XP_062211407.1 KH domain-containing protein HEN4-like [Phragmites australis]XP_062211408.1 KH domain-containing protein HEN4-like [Phragmites australis]